MDFLCLLCQNENIWEKVQKYLAQLFVHYLFSQSIFIKSQLYTRYYSQPWEQKKIGMALAFNLLRI